MNTKTMEKPKKTVNKRLKNGKKTDRKTEKKRQKKTLKKTSEKKRPENAHRVCFFIKSITYTVYRFFTRAHTVAELG